MKIPKQHLKRKAISFVFLLIGCISVLVTDPIEVYAQDKSIFSNSPQSNPNDDTRLCNATNGPLKDDKYCIYYREYMKYELIDQQSARFYRNKMLFIVKEQVDEYYHDHKGGRKLKNKWFQTVLDILGIGAALAANITNGERAKSVIAASLGAFQAGRNSINERFQLLQFQILINKMTANRTDQWTKIYQSMALNIDQYPWERARGDLQQYFFRGTFSDALDSLVDETGADVAKAKTTLAEFTDKEIKRTDQFFERIKNLDTALNATGTPENITRAENATTCLKGLLTELQKEPRFKAFLDTKKTTTGAEILKAIKDLSRDLSAEDVDNKALIEKFENTIIDTGCKN